MTTHGGGPGRLLLDLPSRGNFSSSAMSAVSLAPTGLRLYICDHETSPPEEQVIKTDPTNILIRSLTLKNSKGDLKGKDKQKPGSDSSKGKRPAERAADGKVGAKRANTGAGISSNRKENGGVSSLTEKDIQGYTVEKLRTLLKERNLPRMGKKMTELPLNQESNRCHDTATIRTAFWGHHKDVLWGFCKNPDQITRKIMEGKQSPLEW